MGQVLLRQFHSLAEIARLNSALRPVPSVRPFRRRALRSPKQRFGTRRTRVAEF